MVPPAPTQSATAPAVAAVKKKPWLKRALSSCEPTLQHHGVIITFILVYSLLNVVIFFVGAAPAWRKGHESGFILRAAFTVARAGGAMLNLNTAFIILVASRTLMTYLRQTFLNLFVPFDKAMPAFHSLIGNFLAGAAGVHTLGHVVRYSISGFSKTGFFGDASLAITGTLLFLVLAAMRITSLLCIRRKSFESFLWTHHVGFVIYFIIILMHGSHKGVLKSWMYVTWPLIIYAVDRISRLMREKGSRLSISRDAAGIKGSDMVCLRIPRTFSYLAGQYCDIKVPLVSNVEWHPFTIASSPHESEMLFYIKVNGDWTRKLYSLFKERSGDHEDINIHVRGPYGAPAQHVGQYEHVVLISGGVGATPFCSITKYAHNWILNYTQRGAAASNSVSAAFTRNQSVQGTPSMPGTPTRQVASGYPSTSRRSRNPSRPISRNHSTNFSRVMSRNFSNGGSRGSHPISRSDSGKFERVHSGRGDGGRPVSRSGSGRLERYNSGRPLSSGFDRSQSGRLLDRVHSVNLNMDRPASGRTADSVGAIIQEQRLHQPFPPIVTRAQSAGNVGIDLGGSGIVSPIHSSDDASMRPFLEMDAVEDDEFNRPDDYEEELGNPDLPIPDRRAVQESPSTSGGNPRTFQLVSVQDDFDSSHMLFDEDEEHVEEEVEECISREGLMNGIVTEGFDVGSPDLEAGGLELEDEILREQHTASNAYNLLGMSFGPLAMMRHMRAVDNKKGRPSVVRTSVNLMDDAMDAALWQDCILFYLHTVTINWLLLWVMFARFSLVFIGLSTLQFTFQQIGFGIFASTTSNVVDLVLALLVTVPIVASVFMEIYVSNVQSFLADHIANSFDLIVLVPLLFACIVLHILNLVGIGDTIHHVSKLTVCGIWPILSLFISWRIVRTIGSRVVLAPYLKSTHAQTKSLDYMWVSKTHEDDVWLVDELLPLAESNIIRLHRFITRHGPKTEPWMLEYEKIPLKTTYSRPDWDEVFGGMVERSKSGTVIGVFFCGPDSMATMIRQAAMRAMAKSMENAYQRGYFSKKSVNGPLNHSSSAITVGDDGISGGISGTGGGGPASGFLNLGGGRGGVNSLTSLDGAGGGGLRSASSRRLGGHASGNLNGPPSQRQSQRQTASKVDDDHAAYGCSVRIAIRVENFT